MNFMGMEKLYDVVNGGDQSEGCGEFLWRVGSNVVSRDNSAVEVARTILAAAGHVYCHCQHLEHCSTEEADSICVGKCHRRGFIHHKDHFRKTFRDKTACKGNPSLSSL